MIYNFNMTYTTTTKKTWKKLVNGIVNNTFSLDGDNLPTFPTHSEGAIKNSLKKLSKRNLQKIYAIVEDQYQIATATMESPLEFSLLKYEEEGELTQAGLDFESNYADLSKFWAVVETYYGDNY